MWFLAVFDYYYEDGNIYQSCEGIDGDYFQLKNDNFQLLLWGLEWQLKSCKGVWDGYLQIENFFMLFFKAAKMHFVKCGRGYIKRTISTSVLEMYSG